MEKKRSGAAPMRPRISADRAGRLYKLLVALGEEPQGRENLAKRLKVGVRTFFRDVDLLRECGAPIEIEARAYVLQGSLEDALGKVPFPDPELTFGEAMQLMRGRSKAHQRLRHVFENITD